MKPRGPIPKPSPQRQAQPAQRPGGDVDASLSSVLSAWSGRSASTPVVQAKLQVGPVDDAFEREADAFASEAMRRMQSPHVQEASGPVVPVAPAAPALHAAPSDTLQPARDPEQEKDTEESGAQPFLRPKLHFGGSSGGTDAPSDFSQRLGNMGNGGSLPASLRGHLEGITGNPLGHVRIHTGAESHELNARIGAKAFTHGRDIYFGQGQYNPATPSGQELIAHEVAHVGQQGGEGVVRRAEQDDEEIEEYVFQEDRDEDLNYILPNPFDPETNESIVATGISWATRFRWGLLLQEYPFPDYLLETEYTRIRGLLLIKALDEKSTLTPSPVLHQPSEVATWSAPSDAMIMDDFAPGFPEWWSSSIEKEFTLSSANHADARSREAQGWHQLNASASLLPTQLAAAGYPIFGKSAMDLQKGWEFVLWPSAYKLPINHPVFDFARAIEAYTEARNYRDAAEHWQARLPHIIQSLATSYYFIINPEELFSVQGIGQMENRLRLKYLPGNGSSFLTFFSLSQDMVDPSRHIPISPLAIFHFLNSFPSKGFEMGRELFEEKQAMADGEVAKMGFGDKVITLADWSIKNGYLMEEAGEYLKKILNDPSQIIDEIGRVVLVRALKKLAQRALSRGVPIIGWIMTAIDVGETASEISDWVDKVDKVLEYVDEIKGADTVEDLQYLSHHLSTVVSHALLQFLLDMASEKLAGTVSEKMIDPAMLSNVDVKAVLENNPGLQQAASGGEAKKKSTSKKKKPEEQSVDDDASKSRKKPNYDIRTIENDPRHPWVTEEIVVQQGGDIPDNIVYGQRVVFPDHTHVTKLEQGYEIRAVVGVPKGRAGYEDDMAAGSELNKAKPKSDRAHSLGDILGRENPFGIYYAHRRINRSDQKKIELEIKQAYDTKGPDDVVVVEIVTKPFPRTLSLQEITYKAVRVDMTTLKRTTVVHKRLEVSPDGQTATVHQLMPAPVQEFD